MAGDGVSFCCCRFIYSWTGSKFIRSFRVCEFISFVRHFMIANELKWEYSMGPEWRSRVRREWQKTFIICKEYILSIVCQRGFGQQQQRKLCVQSFDILDDFQVENIQLCAFESNESPAILLFCWPGHPSL